jgi:coenzyme PQQ precursor peptide PqqA
MARSLPGPAPAAIASNPTKRELRAKRLHDKNRVSLNLPAQGRPMPGLRKMQERPPIQLEEINMAWTTPEIVEICVGMEITSYSSAEI